MARVSRSVPLFVLGSLTLFAQKPSVPVSSSAAAPVVVTKKDAKKSDELLHRAVRLQNQGQLEDATRALDESVSLNPNNGDALTAREYVRAEEVGRHMDAGNRLMLLNERAQAEKEFRAALALDPDNLFAQQRLRDATGAEKPTLNIVPRQFAYATEPKLQPKNIRRDITFRGDTRGLWESIGKAWGLSVFFDDGIQGRPVRLNVQDVDFPTASLIARRVTKTFFIKYSPTEILVANDSPEVRRRLERLSLRSYSVSGINTPQELQELQATLRILFPDVRFIASAPGTQTLAMRAPKAVLDAAGDVLNNLTLGRPELMLDIQAIEVSESGTRDLGIALPLQFTLFNVNTEVSKLLSTPGAQDAINRILAGGNINPSDVATIAALLASQQGGANNPLLGSFASFGGGNTRTGVVVPPLSATAGMTSSILKHLQDVTMRAQEGRAATFRIGDRFPVLTQSYSSLVSAPTNSRLTDNSSLQPLVPAFNYEDLGITLKATPQVGADRVTLQLELSIKALAGVSLNGVPTISNREYKGTIGLKLGEASLLAGSLSESEIKSLSGLPLLSRVPGLRPFVSTSHRQMDSNNLLFLVTPRLVRNQPAPQGPTEVYLEGQ